MLDAAKRLITASARSDVAPFMAMDVMAAAARLEAQGRRIVHMEVGQPAAPAPSSAIAVTRAALETARIAYTEALGIPSLRARIARHYAESYGLNLDPARVVVTTGSSAGFLLAFLALFEPGERVAMARPGYPPYRHILTVLGCIPWVTILGVAGYELGANWSKVLTYTRPLEYAVLAAVVVGIALALVRRRKASRATV